MVEDLDEEMPEEDDIEEGMDELEEEKEEKVKSKTKAKKPLTEKAEETPQDIWEPFHQEAILGLRNTLTGTTIPGFQDVGVVQAMALVLNMHERLSTTLG